MLIENVKRELARPNYFIVDVGCGMGECFSKLSTNVFSKDHATMVYLDFSVKALKIAHSKSISGSDDACYL